MVFTRFIPARGVLLAAAFVFLFQAGCGLFAPRGKTLSVKIAPRVKMRFVYIEPLKIFAGKYEVSNREYRCFRPAHSSGSYEGMSLDGDRQPAVNVSWKDANAFCAWLTKNYGATPAGSFVFRLPTEKEWETYAAGGSGAEFPWGAWPPPKHLNYYGRENKGVAQSLETYDGYRVSCPVHKSCANALGLYGVAGNVWEWCQDKDEPQSAMRVLKGASWADCAPLFLRTGRRSAYEPDYKYINLGFRVVAEPS
ncbi:MAG: SUMF1/EgtB/PvdO family nonheme iron enzyme, partial [Kiritimatiellae bacterium]|nr:SUMF1/EgtB/PvdO family nonheme iron enzyme [Kiritimatiellia bacterium]